MPLVITTRGFNEALDLPLLTPARQREAEGEEAKPIRSSRAQTTPASPRAEALYKAKTIAREYHRAHHVRAEVLRSASCRECALEQVEATLQAAAPAWDGTVYRLVALHAGDHRYLHAALTDTHPLEWVRRLRQEALVDRVHGQIHAHLRANPHARLGAQVLRERALPTARHLRRVFFSLRSQGHPVMLGATHLPHWVRLCETSDQVFAAPEDVGTPTPLPVLAEHPSPRGAFTHPQIPAPRQAVESEWVEAVAPTG